MQNEQALDNAGPVFRQRLDEYINVVGGSELTGLNDCAAQNDVTRLEAVEFRTEPG